MTINRPPINKQSGFGLIEILLVLAIVAVITVGAMSLFGSASNSSKADQMQRGLGSIVAAAHSIYITAPDYTGIGAASLIASGALPKYMVSGAALASPFGSITVAANTNTHLFDVTYEAAKTPIEVCQKFVPTMLGVARTIKVGATTVTDSATANTACAAGTNGLVTGTIVFSIE